MVGSSVGTGREFELVLKRSFPPPVGGLATTEAGGRVMSSTGANVGAGVSLSSSSGCATLDCRASRRDTNSSRRRVTILSTIIVGD